MMRKIVASVFLLSLFLSVYSVAAPGYQRVMISFYAEPDTVLLAQHGATVHTVFERIPVVVATVPLPAVFSLSQNPAVKYIEPDSYRTFVEPLVEEKQPSQVLPWNIDRIDADQAWQYSTGKEVKVAVVDTGIDQDHPDLEENIKGGINTIAPGGGYTDPDDFDDDHGHGTFCAGIIAAIDNDIGVVGVAPDAHLYGVKVLNGSGSGYYSDVVEGILWCIDKGMQVINLSFGTGESQALREACDAAWENGAILVTSEGLPQYPNYMAFYPSVMAMSGVGMDMSQPYQYGRELELAAPCEAIYSTIPGGYATMSGLSFSCPHVAGTAALVIARFPTMTNQQVRYRLWNTAEDLGAPGWDPYYGYGLVDAEAAVA
ncbi:MAG: S8 family peptidase [Theionarchaea archaeon]|nr:S8 family peptidase [Theionarchaea archaeon]